MTTTFHGSVPDGVRDHHGVLGNNQSATPQARLAEAQMKVAQLERQHKAARAKLRAACDDDEGQHDLKALKANVASLARDLAMAEGEAEQWSNVCEQTAKADQSRQVETKLAEARRAREQFAAFFTSACLALGRWYSLGSEISNLVNALADRLPTGTVYYKPELKNVLAELGEDPNPLPALREDGYKELSTTASWRRQCPVVPLKEK